MMMASHHHGRDRQRESTWAAIHFQLSAALLDSHFLNTMSSHKNFKMHYGSEKAGIESNNKNQGKQLHSPEHTYLIVRVDVMDYLTHTLTFKHFYRSFLFTNPFTLYGPLDPTSFPLRFKPSPTTSLFKYS